jgi:polysaccharide export outer membrane protein
MKWGSLLLLAFSVPAPFCHGQNVAPTDAPAAQEAAKPAVPAAAQRTIDPSVPPAAQETAKLAVRAAVLAADGSYVIGASDVITVTVLKETTLSGSLLVRPDGMITMPLLGDVRASGFTPLQLGGEIAIRLKKYIQDPNVSVILTQINSKKVYLIGEVSKIGPVDITPGMTLLEAISSAGGLTQYANAKKIYILRNEDGKHARLPVSYKEALKGNGALNLILKPGDTIVVP